MKEDVKTRMKTAGKKTKEVVGNAVYLKNILLFVASLVVLIIASGTFGILADALHNPSWWSNVVITMTALTMMFLSMNSIFTEKFKTKENFIAAATEYANKVYCANNNQDLGTYDGLQREVDLYNKQRREVVWRKKLKKVIGSLYGGIFNDLNKSFDDFESKYPDEVWIKYFEEKEFSTKQRNKVMNVVNKIRNDEYKIKGVIVIDDLLYDTFGEGATISPVYNEGKATVMGTLTKSFTFILTSVIFATVYFQQAPDAAGWVIAVLTRIFMISTTIFSAYNLSVLMDKRRRNALKKRINMLESAFNYINLPWDIRNQYYETNKTGNNVFDKLASRNPDLDKLPEDEAAKLLK